MKASFNESSQLAFIPISDLVDFLAFSSEPKLRNSVAMVDRGCRRINVQREDQPNGSKLIRMLRGYLLVGMRGGVYGNPGVNNNEECCPKELITAG